LNDGAIAPIVGFVPEQRLLQERGLIQVKMSIEIWYRLKRAADLWIPVFTGMTLEYFLFADP